MRIACLQAPEFPTDVLAPDEPCAPVAVLRGEGTHAHVVAVSEGARALDVRRGLNPAQARAKCADLRLVRWDERRIVAAERALAAALAAECAPRVARAGPEGSGLGAFWIDASGLARLGGERALAARARTAAVRAGHRRVRLGLAGSAVAASVAARAADRTPAGLVSVPEGGDPAFLAGHPIAWLPLPPEVLHGLSSLGLSCIGELAALPLEGLGARLGPGGVEAWRLAHGIDVRGPLTPPAGPDVIEEVDLLVDSSAPVSDLEPLLFVLRGMLARVEARLESQGLAAASLDLVLVREGEDAAAGAGAGGEVEERRRIRPARATAQARALWELCRIVLEEQGLGGPVARLRVETVELAPASREQGDLWQARWHDPAAAEAVLARLRARLGEEAVVRPVEADAHRPEGRGRFVGFELASGAGAGAASASASASGAGAGAGAGTGAETIPWALRLLEDPLPVDVALDDDVPVAVEGQEVLEAWGPERLSGEWWTERPFDRAYWRVATARQEWLWIFEEPAGEGRFFLHGWWD